MRAQFNSIYEGVGLASHSDTGHSPVQKTVRYRAVFISDLHLGTPDCQADALLGFLKASSTHHLYLVGDIIDGWELKRRWFWSESHNLVIQKLLRTARKGCKITFVPGNHDEFARKFLGHHFGGIEVVPWAVHTTALGKKMWVIHGDQFDGVIQYPKWLTHLGDKLNESIQWMNRHFNRFRGHMGLPYWSLSAYLKCRIKEAEKYVNDFEEAVAKEAKREGYDGVVCGHIHRAETRDINGTLYCNDGDWVESCSALVEHHDGRLEIIHWAHTVDEAAYGRLPTAAEAPVLVA